MRIFVTGAEGQVARALKDAGKRHPNILLGFGARPALDLTHPDSIRPLVAAFKPDLVVNPAAYTAVDRAEAEPDLAFAINRDGAEAVAVAAAELGVPIIHLSTDYVFNGTKEGRYVESDPVDPQGVYGRSKLESEIAVARANSHHLILRTAWVYAPYGANFVRTMIRLSSERDSLRVVDDQIGCPTYAADIANAILAIAQLADQETWRDEYNGVTHLAGPDAVTWAGFASAIVRGANDRGGRSPTIEAITTAEYPTPAKRPANSMLDTKRLAELFGITLPSLTSSLTDCLNRLLGEPNVNDRSAAL